MKIPKICKNKPYVEFHFRLPGICIQTYLSRECTDYLCREHIFVHVRFILWGFRFRLYEPYIHARIYDDSRRNK